MVTNQNMVRDKESFIQRTKDSYFNATKLLDSWNKKPNVQKKQLARYYANTGTEDFINQLKKEGIENPYTAGRGKGENSGTWMHPKLFIDFAMWLSVEFKSIVIDYVLDGLIRTRTDAGDYYNEMCAMTMKSYIEKNGCKPPPMLYINEATLIKKITKIDKQRNEMTEKELYTITTLQKLNTQMIKEGIGRASRLKHLKLVNKALYL